jgi:glutathione S-transferase
MSHIGKPLAEVRTRRIDDGEFVYLVNGVDRGGWFRDERGQWFARYRAALHEHLSMCDSESEAARFCAGMVAALHPHLRLVAADDEEE